MIAKVLKVLFGDKSEKDIKEIKPHVDKTLVEYSKLNSISDDELRAKTPYLKAKINTYISSEEGKISELKQKVDTPKVSIQDKEDAFAEIEKIEKIIDTKIEEILLEILPEAFAVVKETARRYAENKFHQMPLVYNLLELELRPIRHHHLPRVHYLSDQIKNF